MNTPTPTPRTIFEAGITFHCGQASQEIMRLDEDGMTYKGQRIEDGGEAHRTFLEVMSAMQPTPRTDTGITLTGTYTCTHHNDAERTACPVCLVTALTAERDQLRAALALGQLNCDAAYDELRADSDELRGDVVRLTAERDELRSDCENETKWAAHYLADAIASKARAERAEAAETVALAQWNGALERAMKAEAEAHQWKANHDNQVKLKGLIMSRPDLGDRAPRVEAIMVEVAEANARAEKAEAELTAEREKVRVLRSALENLCDEQNGAPLETRRGSWQLAMDEAGLALAATEGAK
jgi:hypothetical protein